MPAGQLIALEGPKASGKSTLIRALIARLAELPSAQVLLTKEPTPAFDLDNEQHLEGVELAAAIAEDRRRHVAEVIGPALADGRVIICDRYVLSSLVFHTFDGVGADVIEDLNRDFPAPSLNVVLRVSPPELHRRRAVRGPATRLQDEAEAETAAYLHYAGVMESRGVPSRVVDNSAMTDHHQLLEWLLARVTGDSR